MVNNVVGIIRDENDLVDVTRRNSTDFMYRNEMGDNVLYSFFEDIDAVPATRELFEKMINSVTEKMHEKGIPVKGFIFAKNSYVILQEDDATAYITDTDAENIRQVKVAVTTEDIEDGDDDYGYDDEGGESNDEGYADEADTDDTDIDDEDQSGDDE